MLLHTSTIPERKSPEAARWSSTLPSRQASRSSTLGITPPRIHQAGMARFYIVVSHEQCLRGICVKLKVTGSEPQFLHGAVVGPYARKAGAFAKPGRVTIRAASKQMSLGPGTRLGPYEIVSAIGAGAMGEVYRARDTRLQRDVAWRVSRRSLGLCRFD